MDDIFSYEMQFLAFERKPYIKKRKLENPICLPYISFGPLECIFLQGVCIECTLFCGKSLVEMVQFLIHLL